MVSWTAVRDISMGQLDCSERYIQWSAGLQREIYPWVSRTAVRDISIGQLDCSERYIHWSVGLQ